VPRFGWNRRGQCQPRIQSSANACESSVALSSMQWKPVAIRSRRSRCAQGRGRHAAAACPGSPSPPPQTHCKRGTAPEWTDRAPRVNSFRFEVPSYHGVGQIQPGQRLVVRATIGGVDVQRPYTLTSSVTERRYYEITVQREPHGIMSNWLFDNMGPGSAVAILPPSGTCFFELHEPRPLVCVVV